MNKKMVLLLAVLVLLLPVVVVPANAMVDKASLFTFHSQNVLPASETVVGKVIFVGPMSAAEQGAVDWMVTVVLQQAVPNRSYLVYVERDFWSGVYVSVGLMSTDAYGGGSFHYNGRYGTDVSSYLGIVGSGTYVLSVCLNDVTGIAVMDPVGLTVSVGVSVYLSAASSESWAGTPVVLS
jgi:hypothetical protein